MEGMASDPLPGERINLFSLVTYLPEPLAGFIDHLRQELVPGCSLRAHVTYLVPRPLRDAEVASEHIRKTLRQIQPEVLERRRSLLSPRWCVALTGQKMLVAQRR
jgi:hypothetical protein